MNKKGFSLIELLVVIAIIAVLSTLAVVALGSARHKANDAKRLSDIKEVQTALELYYSDNKHYPTSTDEDFMNIGVTGVSDCLNSTGGFINSTGCPSPYMGLVPADPTSGTYYQYKSAGDSSYFLTGSLYIGAGNFGDGTVTATESGMIGQPL